MAHGVSHSKERLRHDLGVVLQAFILRSQREHSATTTIGSATKQHQQQQQHRPAPGNFGRPSAVTPSAAAAAASSLHAVPGEPRATSHALACRITQHGRPPSGASSAPTVPHRGHLVTDGGATHRLPSPPATKHHQGRPAAPCEVTTVVGEQITLPKKIYSDYSQAPPSKESSTQLTVTYQVTEVLRENRSSRSELTSERDVLYERVAQRLDEIAMEINHKYFNQGDGPAQRQLTLAVADLVKEATAKSFNNTVSRLIPHDQPEVQQLAFLYQLTAAAIHTVGSGTTQACQLADLCVQYAFDRFAGFIMAKGGLDLAVGDSDFEVD